MWDAHRRPAGARGLRRRVSRSPRYRFGKYKSDGETPPGSRTLTFVVADPPAEKSLDGLWRSIEISLAGVTLARDLVNEPAAVKTPTYLATLAKKLGKESGIEVEVWEPKRIASRSSPA